jgi:hypothetical protein
MQREAIHWVVQRLPSKATLRQPFAVGFLAGLALSGAVLAWPTQSGRQPLTPVSEDVAPDWQPNPTGRREA